jgi:hypothetical protein
MESLQGLVKAFPVQRRIEDVEFGKIQVGDERHERFRGNMGINRRQAVGTIA